MAESGRTLTYGELDDNSARLASALHGMGLRKGDVIAVLSDNTLEAFEIYWAALRSGLYITAVNWHLAAEEAEGFIAHHGAGEQAGFEEDLEAVADAEDEAARAGEAVDRFHHGGEAGDGAGAEVVAESEAAGEDDDVGVCEIFGLVPDEFDGLREDGGDGVEGVVVAIGAGETDYAEFHFW